MNAWHSYPKVWNLGHPQVDRIFEGPVVVQEKYDGSQFSFGVIEGNLRTRSRGREFDPNFPPNLFKPTVEYVMNLFEKGKLVEEWVYRGEAFRKEKHNMACYGRIPSGHMVLYDIGTSYCTFADPLAVKTEAESLGFEPAYRFGSVSKIDMPAIQQMLQTTSSLGKCLVEGVVVKNYSQFTRDGKVMMAKYVSEAFRESHKSNPEFNKNKKDFVEAIGLTYNNAMRFEKAVQHLRDQDLLLGEHKDIGPLLKELNSDLEEEEAENIKEMLYSKWRKDIMKVANRGFAEWYKQKLAERQFYEDSEDNTSVSDKGGQDPSK
jgi:hypothetical protein